MNIINGTSGNDANFFEPPFLLAGTNEDDLINGLAGDDVLVGEGGNDTLDGGIGIDRMFGRIGDDVYIVDNVNDKVTELIDEGIDTVISSASYSLLTSGTQGATSSQAENLTLTGNGDFAALGNGLNNVIIGNSGNNFISGEFGADKLFGGGGNDQITSGSDDTSNDEIDGGTGFDRLNVSNINKVNFTLTDTTVDAAGLDTFKNIEAVGITGNGFVNRIDALAFSVGEVTLIGGGGSDMLLGGRKDDTLGGGEGGDILAGAAGNDKITGSFGLDDFVYNTGTTFKTSDIGVDLITDFTKGQDRISLDRTTFKTLASKIGVGFSQADEFAVVTSDDAINTASADIIYNSTNGKLFYNSNGTKAGLGFGGQFATINTNFTKTPLSANDFFIRSGSPVGLTGTPTTILANDIIQFTGVNAGGIIQGNRLNNTINSKGGNDTVLGGAGDDVINGGTGDDLLWGGSGNNTMIGAAGADTILLDKGAGVDVIKGFQQGVDRLGLKAYLTFDDLSFTQQGSYTQITFGRDRLALIENSTVEQFSAEDFVNVSFKKVNGVSAPVVM